jgi:PQQ-dependent catabolism-associated CXXCW motif protein
MIPALLMLLAAPVDPALFDPATGYRIASYRGVIPTPPPGVARIDDATAARMQEDGALFVDVAPAAGAQHDAATGAWRLAEPHDTIPGAHWFPEAGRGTADAATDRWLVQGVRALALHSGRRAIVVFCYADCWMSWNAALKLRRAGLRHLLWYANGSDGWRDLGRSLMPVRPENDPAPAAP